MGDLETFLIIGVIGLIFYFVVWKDPKMKAWFQGLFSSKPGIPTAVPVPTTPTKRVLYKNTPPIVNAKVYFIFWGADYDKPDLTPTREQLKTSMMMLLNSNYFDGLDQYGGIKKPTLGGFADNKTFPVPPAADIPLDNLDKVVADSIAKGIVPPASPEIIYFVFWPPGHYSSYYGGTHYMSTVANAHIAMVINTPEQVHNLNNLLVPNNLDMMTQAVTHELVDSLTDSGGDSNGYVMDDCGHLDTQYFGQHCEVAQYCGHYLKRVNGVLVEGYYSDRDGKCIVPGTVLTKADSVRPEIDV